MSWTVIAIVTTVASATVSYAQGQAQKDAANANATLTERNSKYQLTIARLNEQVQMRQAEFEQQVSEMQAQASYSNAQAARNEAEAVAAQDMENAARQRKVAEQAIARNRGIYAEAGLVDTTGTPLAMLAEQAMLEESAVADSHYLANLERGNKLRESKLYQLEGDTKRFEGLASKAVAKEASMIRGLTSQVNYNLSMKRAEIERRTGVDEGNATQIGAIVSGIGGVSSSYQKGQTRKLRQSQLRTAKA